MTHANRTFNLMNNFIKSGVQVSIDIRPTLKRGEKIPHNNKNGVLNQNGVLIAALRGLKEISSR